MNSLWGFKRPEITFLFQLAIRLDKRLREGGLVADNWEGNCQI